MVTFRSLPEPLRVTSAEMTSMLTASSMNRTVADEDEQPPGWND